MTYVLGVTAGEIRHPIAHFVEMKADNLLLQESALFHPEFFLPLGRHHIRMPGRIPHHLNVRFGNTG